MRKLTEAGDTTAVAAPRLRSNHRLVHNGSFANHAAIRRELRSESRALADLPGIESARIDEPEPERVYAWKR